MDGILKILKCLNLNRLDWNKYGFPIESFKFQFAWLTIQSQFI